MTQSAEYINTRAARGTLGSFPAPCVRRMRSIFSRGAADPMLLRVVYHLHTSQVELCANCSLQTEIE